MARTARKAAPATSKNAQQRITPLDKVRKAIVAVSRDKGPGNRPITDEDRRAAVLDAIKLRELPVDVSAFVIKYAHLVHGATKLAAETLVKADTQLKEAESVFNDRKAKLAQAKATQQERTADEVRFAHSVVKVHRIMTTDQLAAAWGISKTGISKMTAAAHNASQLGALNNNANVSYLLTVGAKDSKALKAAMSKPGATMATVREATTTTQSKTTRTQQEQGRGEADTLDVQAHRELAQLVNTLRVLVKNGQRVADIGDVKAADLFKELGVLARAQGQLKVAADKGGNVVPIRPEPQPVA